MRLFFVALAALVCLLLPASAEEWIALPERSRVQFDYTLNEQSRVQTVVFYQPVWDTFDDYYVVITNTLVVGISNGLALTVSHDFNHDATPAEGIVRDDAFLSVGFRYVF